MIYLKFFEDFQQKLLTGKNLLDLTFGTNQNGTKCLFLEETHIAGEWELSEDAKEFIRNNINSIKELGHSFLVQFIHNGVETKKHCWVVTQDPFRITHWG